MKNLLTFILLFVCVNAFAQKVWKYPNPVDSANHPFHTKADFMMAEFGSTADFEVAVFDSAAIFAGAKFHSTANFSFAKFDSTNSFMETVFDSETDFQSAEFHSTADFYLTQFNSTANFCNAKLYSIANFVNTRFNSAAYFSGAVINSSAEFHSLFNSAAYFEGAKFHSNANFRGAEFHSIAIFNGAAFDSAANFLGAVFKSVASFSGAEFKSGAAFNYTLLPDTLDFSRVIKIKDEIDFTSAILDSAKKAGNKEYKCRINLTGSDLRKIKINYELFQLYFPKETRNEDKISTYEKLRQRFKDDGFLESYKSLDIEYQDYKNRKNGDCFLNWFQKTWWNYGYNKEQVIYWALKFLCFFTLINIFLFEFLQSKVYSINFKFYEKEEFNSLKEQSKLERQQRENIFFSSVIHLKMGWNYFLIKIINPLVYTMILFFVLKISIENFKKFSGWVLYIWLIYIAGVFCLAYIFNIIIVK